MQSLQRAQRNGAPVLKLPSGRRSPSSGNAQQVQAKASKPAHTGRERSLKWSWEKCIPLAVIGTAAVVVVLATMLGAWVLSETPQELWQGVYFSMVRG